MDVQWAALRLLNERSLAPIDDHDPPSWPKVGDMIITFLLKKSGDGWVAEQVESA
jgi:hypothetical protein